MANKSKEKYKYLIINVIAFLCGNIGTKLISFFMVPLYTNILLPAEYGEIDLILSVAGVVSPFIACGIHEGIMRFSLDKGADRGLVLSIGMRVFGISTGAFLVLVPLLYFVPIISGNVWFIYGYVVLNELMTICLCYIRGCDNVKLYSFLGFLSALITASLNILFLVFFGMGLYGYKVAMLLSPTCMIVIAMAMGKIAQSFDVRKWDTALAKEMLGYSLLLIPNALLWWCINASDRFFVSYICSTAINGIYAVSYKIPTLLSTVSSIFMQGWQMSAIKEHENGADKGFSDHVYRALTFFMGVTTLVLLMLNKTLLSVYVGPEYQTAWMYSPPLIAAFFLGALGTFWGSFYIAAKKMKAYLLSALSGAMVNVVLNYALISQCGALGAAIATMISYAVVLLVRGLGISRQTGILFANKELVSSIICVFVAVALAYLPGLYSPIAIVVTLVAFVLINTSRLKELLSMVKRMRA